MSTTQTTTLQGLHAAPSRVSPQVNLNHLNRPIKKVSKAVKRPISSTGQHAKTSARSAASGSSSGINQSATESRKGVNEAYSKPSDPDAKIKALAAAATKEFVAEGKDIKKAGEYLIGPSQGTSPVKCISQFLARKENTDEFYVIKILTLKNPGEKETMDDIQGKTLIHTEHSLLSLLQNESGVVHEHGLFKETVLEESKEDGTMKEVRRLCLVLDCFITHDFTPKYSNVTNIQYHVIKEKKLPESEALRIFYKVVKIVDNLHKLNIVHRDLKLGNIILNKDTKEVSLANFCLGKHLGSERELLKDQRGSPAYISPDVINGKPYLGKPSDMWALGVSLYTMLYGQFPFYDQSPSELFRKIKIGEFQIPVDINVSSETVELIKSLLHMDPAKRVTSSAALDKVKKIIAAEKAFLTDSDLQVVPDCHAAGPLRGTKKRSLCADRSSALSDSELVDLASFLVRSSSSEVDDSSAEPSRKLLKASGNGRLQLEKFQAMYKACTMMMKEAVALLSEDSSSSTGLQFSSSPLISSNGLIPIKCATNSANNYDECARVPTFNNYSVPSPTSTWGSDNGDSDSKSFTLNGSAPQSQSPLHI